jgi:ribonuclease HI
VRVVVHTDGASRGNPGLAGIGVVVLGEGGEVLAEVARALGITTNNRAEYEALLEGLRQALALGADEVTVRSDSELLVRQVLGRYAVRSAELKPYVDEARRLLARFRRIRVEHVPRAANAHADALANRAIDATS